jgi:hypothetical protein
MKEHHRFCGRSTVAQVVDEPAFEGFGRLLFPVDLNIKKTATLQEISSSRVYLWYSNIQAGKTVEVLNNLYDRVLAGEEIFYPLYTQEEQKRNPKLKDTGIFFLRGEPGARFGIMNAGGGFYYVAALHDSFPHALELSRRGHIAFVLIYHPESPWEDLGRALCFIEDHADELAVDPLGYSLWGGSAGARMAAVLGNRTNLERITGRKSIGWREVKSLREANAPLEAGCLPQASAVIMQYTGYNICAEDDAPTYACLGTNDSIAS